MSLKDFETLRALTGEIRSFIEIISLKSQDKKELAVKSETGMLRLYPHKKSQEEADSGKIFAFWSL